MWKRTGATERRGFSNYEKCICSCGTVAFVRVGKGDVLRGTACRSCSGRRGAVGRKPRQKTHAESATAEYKAWGAMRNRIGNPHNERFKNYGGRGIRICERWQSYENFLADLGRKPAPWYSLERKDVNGNYEPGNCHWATRVEQASNRTNSRLLTYRSETKTAAEWSRVTGLRYLVILKRILRGWDVERTLTTPMRSRRKAA